MPTWYVQFFADQKIVIMVKRVRMKKFWRLKAETIYYEVTETYM